MEGLTRLQEHRLELQHRLDMHRTQMEMPPSPSPSSRSLAPFSSASSSLSEGSNQPSGEDSASIVTGTLLFYFVFSLNFSAFFNGERIRSGESALRWSTNCGNKWCRYKCWCRYCDKEKVNYQRCKEVLCQVYSRVCVCVYTHGDTPASCYVPSSPKIGGVLRWMVEATRLWENQSDGWFFDSCMLPFFGVSGDPELEILRLMTPSHESKVSFQEKIYTLRLFL